MYKSTDGGTTWSQLTDGLPKQIGRSFVAVAPSNTQVAYAIVDAPDGCALYRSDNAGAKCRRSTSKTTSSSVAPT